MTGDASYETRWKERYECLKKFKEIYGHCNVISKDPINKQLSRWVENQRMFYRKKKLPPHRIALLESLGFEWVRPHRSQTNFSKKNDTIEIPLPSVAQHIEPNHHHQHHQHHHHHDNLLTGYDAISPDRLHLSPDRASIVTPHQRVSV